MEATKIKMNMDGTIRAKVLQYKSDGNTLTEKWHTLTKFADGIYISNTPINQYGDKIVNIIFFKNGIFWRVGVETEQYFDPESLRYAEHMETLKTRYANYEADILQAASNGGWLNKLHITVMERLGHDVAPLLAAYEERRRKWQENECKRIEAAEKAEQERKEAEERHKAEVLADGKKKLMNHERITVEQIELIAEAVGYKINIRTLGFMREKVTEVVLREDDTVTVWGRKLTSRNIDGTANVVRELYNRLKAQAEEEITEPVKHISEIIETCRLHDENTGEETDEYKYYKWLTGAHCGTYRTIADMALAEALAWIFEAVYRKGSGHIIAKNKDGVLIETVIAITPAEMPQISTETTETVNVSAEGEKEAERANIEQNHSDTRIVKDEYCHKYKVTRHWLNGRVESIEVWDLDHTSEPPQSPETPQTVEYATDTPEPRETARKRPNRAIGSAHAAQRNTLRDTLRPVTYVPRECCTADAAYWESRPNSLLVASNEFQNISVN